MMDVKFISIQIENVKAIIKTAWNFLVSIEFKMMKFAF